MNGRFFPPRPLSISPPPSSVLFPPVPFSRSATDFSRFTLCREKNGYLYPLRQTVSFPLPVPHLPEYVPPGDVLELPTSPIPITEIFLLTSFPPVSFLFFFLLLLFFPPNGARRGRFLLAFNWNFSRRLIEVFL